VGQRIAFLGAKVRRDQVLAELEEEHASSDRVLGRAEKPKPTMSDARQTENLESFLFCGVFPTRRGRERTGKLHDFEIWFSTT
jgi:hypothetical protein